MADLTPFANVEEFADYWRVLTDAETTRATALLVIASNRLRLMAEAAGVDIETKNTDSEVYASTLKWIVMEAVKRAMQTPIDQPSVESYAQTAGPYSENFKYANPSGDLWFRKAELSALGLSGIQTLTSISTAPEDYYS